MAPIHNSSPLTGTIPKSNGTARARPNTSGRQNVFGVVNSSGLETLAADSATSAPNPANRWDQVEDRDSWRATLECPGELGVEDTSLDRSLLDFDLVRRLTQQQEIAQQIRRRRQRQEQKQIAENSKQLFLGRGVRNMIPDFTDSTLCSFNQTSSPQMLPDKMEMIRSLQAGTQSPGHGSYLPDGEAGFDVQELLMGKAQLLNKLKELEGKKRQLNELLHQVSNAASNVLASKNGHDAALNSSSSRVTQPVRQNSNSPSVYSSSSSTNHVMLSQSRPPPLSLDGTLHSLKKEVPELVNLQARLEGGRDMFEDQKKYPHGKAPMEADGASFPERPIKSGVAEVETENIVSDGENVLRQIHFLRLEVGSLREYMETLQLSDYISLPSIVRQQQWQVQQLTMSVDRCCHALLNLQKDIGFLRFAVERQSSENHNRPTVFAGRDENVADGVQYTPSGANNTWIAGNQNRTRDDDSHSDRDHSSTRSAPNNPFESNQGWQNLGLEANSSSFNDPARQMSFSSGCLNSAGGADPWHLLSRHSQYVSSQAANATHNFIAVRPNVASATSTVSPGNGNSALNNQVLPGMRTNNYWDNFRSFSHQNRLSAVAPNVAASGPQTIHGTAASPVIAQVTPRQLQSSVDQFRGGANPATSVGNVLRNGRHSAMVEPYFSNINSPSRPKRKQKINREQNRETTGLSFVAKMNSSAASDVNDLNNKAGNMHVGSRPMNRQFPGRDASSVNNSNTSARVRPMPHLQGQSSDERTHNLNDLRSLEETSPSEIAVLERRSSTVSPAVTSITHSIYGQINNLIMRHEASPDRLEQIFRDLQVISREDNLRTRTTDVNLTSYSSATSTTNSTFGLAEALRQLEANRNVNPSNLNNPNNSCSSNPRRWINGVTRENRESDDHALSADDEDEAMFKLTINQKLALSDGEPSALLPDQGSNPIRINPEHNLNSSGGNQDLSDGVMRMVLSDQRRESLQNADSSTARDAEHSSSPNTFQGMLPRKRRANNLPQEDLAKELASAEMVNGTINNGVSGIGAQLIIPDGMDVRKHSQRNSSPRDPGTCKVQPTFGTPGPSVVKMEKLAGSSSREYFSVVDVAATQSVDESKRSLVHQKKTSPALLGASYLNEIDLNSSTNLVNEGFVDVQMGFSYEQAPASHDAEVSASQLRQPKELDRHTRDDWDVSQDRRRAQSEMAEADQLCATNNIACKRNELAVVATESLNCGGEYNSELAEDEALEFHENGVRETAESIPLDRVAIGIPGELGETLRVGEENIELIINEVLEQVPDGAAGSSVELVGTGECDFPLG